MIPDKYYTLLGLAPDAGIDAVRKAYRAKVKLCHPDAVSVTDGNLLFIELTEAYEFLMQALKEKRDILPKEESDEPFVVFDPSMQDLIREEMEKLRRLAREEARRKYREYKQSREYKINKVLSRIFIVMFQALGLVIIIFAIQGLYQQFNTPDFSYISAVAAFLVVFVGLIMIIFPIRKSRKKGH